MNLEKNKIIASILLAGLLAMLSGTASKILYGSNSHSETDEKRGYKIEGVVADANATEAKAEEIDKLALIASADATAGANVAKKCVACHSFEKGGANKVGPNLWNIVNKAKAETAGFQYSKTLLDMKSQKWGYEELWAFINAPQAYAKGTKMAFAGVKNPQDLANLIAHLRNFSDSPAPLPAK
ncbi:MAG: cytochrome c family protein [Rickettsiales bacterium]|nr:cytochrome c family protein [Rickettsiales bacterium]